MENYSRLGINRISFGVQDFDPEVMEAVNRVQPAQIMRDLLTPEIRKIFPSIHFDFLIGLPKQTKNSFRKTLDVILELSPERLVLSTYRHAPNIFNHQKIFINENDLPSRTEISEIFSECVERLLANGYKRIGLEYFAKPEDNLTQMYDDESCNWNMIGYSRGNGNKIVGVGLGATSRITDTYYFENMKTLEEYKNSINQKQFPVNRGCKLTRDDMIRREVTVNLRSKLHIDYKYIEDLFEIDFKKYFSKELSFLNEFVEDGLIFLNDNEIRFTNVGKIFSAYVCMVFDAYHENN
jgi:oxygen-independent coproporphyrinogen-3 oxidase